MSLSTVEAFKHISPGSNPIELSGERLGKLQDFLIGMLSDVDVICKRHGISYTLGGGTCLGAVRHQGFIPWDDDVDINMTREGYRRFSQAFLDAFGEKYWLHDCDRTPGYELAFPRVRLKGTVVRSREDYGNEECGAYIDIFLIDNAPSSSIKRAVHGVGSLALGLIYSCRRFAAHADEYLGLAGMNKDIRAAFKKKIFLGRLVSFRSVSAWTRTWDRWNARYHDRKTDFVTMPAGRKHYFGELHAIRFMLPPSQGVFAGMHVPLPADVDEYLTTLYGSTYLEIPPASQREKHVVYEFDLGKYAHYGYGFDNVEQSPCFAGDAHTEEA